MLYLGEHTLLEHSINFAKFNRSIIDRIIVSTDSFKIKEIALAAGVDVIDRPEELASDTASTVSVLKHVLDNYRGEYENVVLLQPTNPLRPEKLLVDAFQIYEKGGFDSLMTVSTIIKKLGKILNNKFSPYNYSFGQRSQDMEPLYYENGLLYICKSRLIKERKLLGENNFSLIVDHPYANVDIDTQEDLEYAEFIQNRYNK